MPATEDEKKKEIVKICKIHGFLTEKEICIEKNKELILGIQKRCKKCRIINDKKSKIKNKTKVAETKKRYAQKNSEKIYSIWQKKYNKKPEARILLRKLQQNHDRKSVSNLDARYIKRLLFEKEKIKSKLVPNILIDVKRILVLLKREIKKQKGEVV